MDLEINGDEFTIKGLIQLEILKLRAIIDTISEEGVCPEPLFVEVHDDLVSLLDQIAYGQITREYAEVELEKRQELQAQWLRDNPVPPD